MCWSFCHRIASEEKRYWFNIFFYRKLFQEKKKAKADVLLLQ